MTFRRATLATLLLLSSTALAGLAPPAAASTGPQIQCDFIVWTEPVATLWQQACGEANGVLDCVGSTPPCTPCLPVPRNCVSVCTLPEVGVTVGNVDACVDSTPPNSAGTTCPPAYGSGKGVYLDYGPVGASPEDKWLCVDATAGGAPCAPGEQRVRVESNVVPSQTRCVSTTPPPPCSTPGPGWGVGVGNPSTCVVYLPWVERSPPAPTTCPPGTLAPVRVWWGQTPGFAPGSFTDVCAV